MEEDDEYEGTSRPRTRPAALNRDREGAHERLVGDYFVQNCVYTDEQFRRWYRMSRRLFLRIANDLVNYDQFFTLRYNARGQRGFTTLQKCTLALRQLAYGTCSDSWDEYVRMPLELVGIVCSNNDLNVIVKSFIFDKIIRGTGPDSSFMLNGVSYKHGYYLAHGIYPPYTAIVKTIPLTDDEKRKKFAKCQEAQEKMLNGCMES
ncbi:uncharacterized protein LOC110882899 [Helianthus annuus]|uniref:uncharacterized protein LOC110882899 n=1 Tax=Helianthus annuus TaxID=4232 RepID=UPI000B8FAECC|nr:uncharacterized protein LOC110882899 [Helianthus annuus]